MLEIIERRREVARTEMDALEAERKELKGRLGILGARIQVVGAHLHILNELRAEVAKTGTAENQTQPTEQTT